MWSIISIIQVLALKSPDRLPSLKEFEDSLLLNWESHCRFWSKAKSGTFGVRVTFRPVRVPG